MTSGNPKTDFADVGGCDAQDDDPPFFAAMLTPYRSLGANGFRILMLVVCAICLVAGLVFLALGAWPVFGFLGLDILLIFLAFRWNYKAARAYEQVSVSRTQGRPTLHEERTANRHQLLSDARSEPTVAALLSVFPGAKVVDVRIQEAEDMTPPLDMAPDDDETEPDI